MSDGIRSALVTAETALREIANGAPVEDPNIEHDDLFGESPDDAFGMGMRQQHFECAQIARTAITEIEKLKKEA